MAVRSFVLAFSAHVIYHVYYDKLNSCELLKLPEHSDTHCMSPRIWIRQPDGCIIQSSGLLRISDEIGLSMSDCHISCPAANHFIMFGNGS